MAEPAAFRMPPMPARRWLDDDGAPIAYGERWGIEGPPDAAYSATSHTERYAPLHAVADALVAHVLAVHDCVAEEDALEPGDVRATRLRPATAAGGIRIAWTDFAGVRARLGDDVDAAAPRCGCDACDEPVDAVASWFCERVLARVRLGAWPLRG